MIKLSDYIAKRLKEHGIEHFFLVSGGGAMHLNDSLGQNITYTACHHEQACAFAAEGYARVNQKMAVVNVTTGPGGLNCLNGLFGQWTDSVPVLYISGQVKRATMMESFPDLKVRQLGDQETDIISTVSHLTKYAVTVKEPNMIKYHLDKAIHEATTGRYGPVWINVPIDIQASQINEDELLEFKPEAADIVNSKLEYEEFYQKLICARRPLIVAGHGIRLSGQIENFKNLIKKLQIPVVTTLNGFDILESSNPHYIGRIGTIGQRAGNFALQNADLVICLGTRNNIRQISYNWENFARNACKVVVDIDCAELKKPLVKPDIPINSDLSKFIPEMMNNAKVTFDEEWLIFCKKLKEKYSFDNRPAQIQKNKFIEPYHFTNTLCKSLDDGDIVLMANGSATVCTFQNAVIKDNQRFITNSGNASMGFGLPAAIGACYQANGRRVICIEGDGSIMMNLQELQTVVKNNLPIKLFIIKNNGYSSIRQTQRNFFEGRMTGCGEDSGVSVPDFIQIGNAFGLETKRIENPMRMEDEIKEVLSSSKPILCEVITEQEYDFMPKLSSRKLADGSMISASLEDMYPFLDRDEFDSNILSQ